MIEHTQILKRSWNILWSYKMLWVFGFLLALASAGGFNGGGGSSYNRPVESFSGPLEDFPPEMAQAWRGLERFFTQDMLSTWIALGVVLVCLALLVGILLAILKYVSLAAQIRMVDEHETTGEKAGFRKGWRLGWSRFAWRLFLIDLAIGVPLTILLIGLFGCALLPVILKAAGGDGLGFGWIMTTVVLVSFLMFVSLVVSLALGLVINLIRRACVLDGEGVIHSIKAGIGLFTRNIKDAAVMWLILAGIHIAYGLVVIPVVLLLLAFGLMVGGGVGVAVYLGLQTIASQAAAIAVAALLGLLLLFTLLGFPLNFLEGLRLTYFSTAWTLTYRALTQPRLVEAPDASPDLPLPGASEPATEIPPPEGPVPEGE